MATDDENNRDDETLALVIQIRDELRAANARLEGPEAPPPPQPGSLASAAVAITPELEAAIAALRASLQELSQTVKEELLDCRDGGSP